MPSSSLLPALFERGILRCPIPKSSYNTLPCRAWWCAFDTLALHPKILVYALPCTVPHLSQSPPPLPRDSVTGFWFLLSLMLACCRFRTGDNIIAGSFYSPTSSRLLEMLLPSVPSLKIVRIRDVRWLRKGLSCHAQEAGVRGEMRVWMQRLAKSGISLVDGNWKDMD